MSYPTGFEDLRDRVFELLLEQIREQQVENIRAAWDTLGVPPDAMEGR
jgi:hypothetical protein